MDFDLTSPSQCLAFRLMLFNLKDIAEQIQEMAKNSHADVIQSFLSRTFYRWKHVPQDESEEDRSNTTTSSDISDPAPPYDEA